MQLISSPEQMHILCSNFRKKTTNVGLVPTMGALHNGHKSLIETSLKENDTTIVSVFLNPTQFNSSNDLESYPRMIDDDSKLCSSLGVDYLFVPNTEQIYPSGYSSWINVGGISDKLCGIGRPGHFRGVSTVVLKLLMICLPDYAYFGEKDYQQFLIVSRMCTDLSLDTQIVLCPIIRDSDGLALSSRNIHLSPEDRETALLVVKAMKRVEKFFLEGENNCSKLIQTAKEILTEPSLELEYIEIVDSETLESLKEIKDSARIMIAIKIGSIRLIDNLYLEL
ncbi:MAG: pantoate--beta-alanine ligase [Nitrospinota bacterium]|nr:pantoate--beta-alanine ligase [Nitrospinota bacterium]